MVDCDRCGQPVCTGLYGRCMLVGMAARQVRLRVRHILGRLRVGPGVRHLLIQVRVRCGHGKVGLLRRTENNHGSETKARA